MGPRNEQVGDLLSQRSVGRRTRRRARGDDKLVEVSRP